jgi:hypothetical protein
MEVEFPWRESIQKTKRLLLSSSYDRIENVPKHFVFSSLPRMENISTTPNSILDPGSGRRHEVAAGPNTIASGQTHEHRVEEDNKSFFLHLAWLLLPPTKIIFVYPKKTLHPIGSSISSRT